MNENELQKLAVSRLSAKESNKITKECICTAFLILLENKSIEEISITELVKRAGVSRSSFYRNYKSKDVFNDIFNTLLKKIRKYLKEYETAEK